jgi:ABC-2 type transport system permease protein
MLPIIFIIPVVQLVVLSHAATFEIKNIDVVVVDHDLSTQSRRLVEKFGASGFFNIHSVVFSAKEANALVISNKVDMILEIPAHFDRDLARHKTAPVQVCINAIDGQAAGLANAYSAAIVSAFNRQVVLQWYKMPKINGGLQVSIDESYWYNPYLNYKIFMVPGILVLLVTIIGMFLSSMNLVREKEIGTIEQINVTPVHGYLLLAGKIIPFFVIALFELALGLTIGHFVLGVPVVGNLALVFLAASIYLFVAIGLGMLVSTMVDTQQQAMFISFFFMMIFVMMSGLFTSVESMPRWGQWINVINPVAYFIRIMRMVLLKGANLAHIRFLLLSLLVYGIVVFSLALARYRKVS